MREKFLPFSRPSITDADISEVAEVLRSGWITTGAKCAEFEKQFREYVGCTEAVALTSATAGMHLALFSLSIGPGDEVITPSLTWVSTINLITLAGAKPVLVDVDRDTLMVSPDVLKAHITDRTRLMIPVHYAGAPADMSPIRKLSEETGIPVVEDAAHAIGTEYKGERIGKHGTTIFSLHPIKNITTGEGGMFCSDDPEWTARIRRLKFHGLGKDAFDRNAQGRAPQAQVQEPGYKYNMTDFSAALGMSQLSRISGFQEKRTRLARKYRELLQEVDEILPLADPAYDMTHAWHLFVIRVDADRCGMSREKFMEGLKERNIGTGIHFLPAHTQTYYRETLKIKKGALPNTEWNGDRICSLPLFPDMETEDVEDVVETIKEVLAHG